MFNPAGSKIYLGSQKGLMQIDATSATPSTGISATVTGNILAVSHDGNRVIVSDTQSAFNQVFIVDVTAAGSQVTLPISGASAAAFSPDNLKAFISSTLPCAGASGACLYVYSTQAALQAIPLGAPVNDVAFLGNGMYGYMAQAAGVSFFPTCDIPGTSPVTAVPSPAIGGSSIHLLPDGLTFLTLNPPNVQEIKASITGVPAPPSAILGCPLPFTLTTPFSATGFLSNTTTASTPVSLGQGNSTPIAFLVSSDGSNAYLLESGVGSVLVYNIAGQSATFIPLVGNNAPVAGA
ncbi:MAG: hypothetical protein DMG68_01765 [Acidobacteria bacterium]|nr:MAG: hypothetical protein DMG68_01765 [Acidobacteriota bacterium]